MVRIIGIDPGLLHTGWAVIEKNGNNRKYVASGVVLPPKTESLPNRLAFIFREVSKLCEIFQPDECSIEITFVNKNPQTTLVLGHARAAAIVAVADKNIPIFEILYIEVISNSIWKNNKAVIAIKDINVSNERIKEVYRKTFNR